MSQPRHGPLLNELWSWHVYWAKPIIARTFYPLFKIYYLFMICIICDICNCVRSGLRLAWYLFSSRAYWSAQHGLTCHVTAHSVVSTRRAAHLGTKSYLGLTVLRLNRSCFNGSGRTGPDRAAHLNISNLGWLVPATKNKVVLSDQHVKHHQK